MKVSSIALFFLLPVSALLASRVSETLSVEAGWNAVYLEATPADSAPADFFADMPGVLRAGAYESGVYDYTGQVASDGSDISQKPVSFFVWERGKEGSSTLQRMTGGRVYLIYATNACEKTFTGLPGQPHVSWQVSDGGFTTLAGVSAPKDVQVGSQVYFREGPAGDASSLRPYAVIGTDSAAPEFMPMDVLARKPKVQGGKAYAFESKTAGDWPGVISLSASLYNGALRIPRDSAFTSFTLANNGTKGRRIRLSWNRSADSGELLPDMRLHFPIAGRNISVWTNFTEHVMEFAAGERRTFVIRVNRSALTEAKYGGVISAEDMDGTMMRVRMGVTVAPQNSDSAPFPAGLWFGNVTLSQVDYQSDAKPVEAGGRMRLNMILHVGRDGKASLFQRIVVATTEQPDEEGFYTSSLHAETDTVPAGHTSRRISAVFPDVAHNGLPPSSGEFGSLLRFDWTVAADARDNPFRHAWHPDHTTGFAVTNRLALSWFDEKGASTYSHDDPDDVTYGIATWGLGGLSGKGDILMRGVFSLKRVSTLPEVAR